MRERATSSAAAMARPHLERASACLLAPALACNVVPPRAARMAGGGAGKAYDQAVPAAATARPWRLAAGALPAGLALEAASGHVRGTPERAGESLFTVAAGPGDAAAREQLTLRILPGAIGAAATATPS